MIFISQKYLSYYLFLCFIFIFFSCEIYNPSEEIPYYVHIDKIDVTTNYSGQGSNSDKITDAWVYIDGDIIGAFEMPVTFPILKQGNHSISIKAGIKINGIAATRGIYPFYKPIVQDINLIGNKVINLSDTSANYCTTTSYYDDITFAWKEDFEDPGMTLVKTDNSDTIISRTSDDVFEGSYSGAIYLDAERPFFEAKTSDAFVLPKGGSPVFLEFNYKTNNKINVGIFSNFSTQSIQHNILIINTTDKWSKIYINLTDNISDDYNAINYNIFFGAQKQDDVSEAIILLDNIKLVHY